ncbi:hypothetical protein AB8Z38_04145 [Bradyrhizobium sp. LLZ17]|uniref:Uncharacterized protein n=1 Tax=Bradyrhizobium sp. LLZ17 TaxID=3239388 RepID=A0AB39XND7_9BRAD
MISTNKIIVPMPPIATIVAAATSEMASHNGNEPWISLESAAWWFDKSSIVLAVSLFIGFVCTVIIIVTGIAKEHHWDLAREAAARKTELLRAENLAFEKYIGPRSVDERALAGALAGHPAGQIEVVLLNHVFDGQKLAEPFVRLLQKGWLGSDVNLPGKFKRRRIDFHCKNNHRSSRPDTVILR